MEVMRDYGDEMCACLCCKSTRAGMQIKEL